MGDGCTCVGILHRMIYMLCIIYRCIDAYGSYQMSLALTRCQGFLPNVWVLTRCLGLLPDVLGSYQMSRVLTKCLGLSPECVDSTQEPPEDAVDERVVFDPNCLHFDHEKGDIWQKSHCNVTIIPEISSVKCRMVCFMEILSHLTIQDKTEMSLTTNIAKGTTDPGVDCFDQ